MNALVSPRGWCPGLFEPMPSGDGLLLRIKPRAARLDAASARVLADAATRHGNGAIELTNRGNLQFRGFTASSAVRFARLAVDAGLADPEPPLDRLPGKFGFVVDGGGCLGLGGAGGDIALRAAGGAWRVQAGHAAIRCEPEAAPGLALRLAHAVLLHDPPLRPARRPGCGPALFRAAGLAFDPVPPAVRAAPAAVGPLPGGAFGIGLPPGRLDASLLAILADLSERCGDGTLRVTPWRSILIAGLRPHGEAVLRAALPDGLLDPDDPRLRVASCIGAPGCARAGRPAPADAARLGVLLPRNRSAGTVLHVSGCAKGCGHPGPAPLTLVGRDGGYDLVRNGRASDAPVLHGLDVHAAAALLRQAASFVNTVHA